MSEPLSVTVTACGESVTTTLRDWRGESLDAYHVARIHDVVDRALRALRVSDPTSDGDE